MSNDKFKDIFLQNVWMPIITAILALILSTLFSGIQAKIGWLPILSSLVLVFAIFLLAMYIVARYIYPVSIGLMESIEDSMGRYVEKGAITWLMSNEQLAEYERKIEVKDIWLVSADLGDDIPGKPFYDVVKNNLERKIKYVYFVPKKLEAIARGQQMLENFGFPSNLDIVYLPDDFFFLTPSLDFIMYDPLNKLGKKEGYMSLPVTSGGRYCGKMEEHFLDLLIGKLHVLISS